MRDVSCPLLDGPPEPSVYVGFGMLHHGQRRPAVHRQLAGHRHYGKNSFALGNEI